MQRNLSFWTILRNLLILKPFCMVFGIVQFLKEILFYFYAYLQTVLSVMQKQIPNFFWDVILSHILSWGETNRNWERFVSLVVEDWDWHVSLCLLMILRYINRRSEPVEWIKEYCVHTPDDDRFIDNWYFICLFQYVLTNGAYNVLKL